MSKSASRTAVITGSARGIGFEIAQRLAQAGSHVVLMDVLDAVEASAEVLRGEGLSAEAEVGDVSDEQWIGSAVGRIVGQRGSVDILVNNAGISPKHNGTKLTVEQMPTAEWLAVLQVNLTAPFVLCRACLPSMRRRGWGRIINISSLAGRARSAIPGAHYGATKAGILGFSRILADEVGHDGITVNCIAPGRIDTPMARVAGDKVNSDYLARIPVGRLGTPADVAATAAFLASDDAGFLTGTVIDVNGGSHMG